MIIAATILKPRERRIRAEGFAEGYKEGFKEGLAEARAQQAAQTADKILELERAARRAWYERYQLALARGEEPPPPPFLCSCSCNRRFG